MIDRFDGEFDFLSNFYRSCVQCEGVNYPTVEHAYQAYKTKNHQTRLFIAQLSTPGEAKKWGRTIDIRPDWEEIEVDVMRYYVRQKFLNNEKLALALHNTGNEELEELS